MLDRPLFLINISLFCLYFAIKLLCLMCNFSCHYPLKMSLNRVIIEIFKEAFNLSRYLVLLESVSRVDLSSGGLYCTKSFNQTRRQLTYLLII